MSAVGVIPARWASTRLPGKSLVELCGKPLVLWVLERASQARRLDRVIVATDDERIADVVTAAGGDVAMTRPDHPSGTDRVAEAVHGVAADIVVNVQGDEPLIDPDTIDRLVQVMEDDTDWDLATLAVPLPAAGVEDPSAVKVVRDESGRALYFSRSVIPHHRDPDDQASAPGYWRHIGIYAYRASFLDRLVNTAPCETELAEKLEQLRALHIGACIKVLEGANEGPGVDTPEDVPYAERALREAGLA